MDISKDELDAYCTGKEKAAHKLTEDDLENTVGGVSEVEIADNEIKENKIRSNWAGYTKRQW